MKSALLSLLIMCAMLAGESRACALLAPAEQAQQDAFDLQKQSALVHQLEAEADSIFVARVAHVSGEPAHSASLTESVISATFVTKTTLKGRERPNVALSWVREISVGCYPSVYFRNVRLLRGQSYLVYAKGGSILRASPLKRSRGEISFWQERRILRSLAGV